MMNNSSWKNKKLVVTEPVQVWLPCLVSATCALCIVEEEKLCSYKGSKEYGYGMDYILRHPILVYKHNLDT